MPGRLFLSLARFLLLLSACSIALSAQTPSVNPPKPNDPTTIDKSESSTGKLPEFGPMEEEMRKKREIKLAEKEYKENLDRAREVSELGEQLQDSYRQRKSLTREDTKKLERIEKLTKRIRSEAGGSDEEASLDDLPHALEPALSRLAEVSGSLRKVVEKTPRQVVSAAVIQQANVVLQLLKFCRNVVN